MREADKPLVLGVAGGSASGKSAVVDALIHLLDPLDAAVLPHDAYYRDLSHMPLAERRRVNVDHPDSLETGLLVEHVEALLARTVVDVPVYDYSTHVRLPTRRTIEPSPLVVVEGILVLADVRLRELMDLAVYVDVPEVVRLERRLERDVNLRGRSPESVLQDHAWRVQPMHLEYIEPSRVHADVVIEEGGQNTEALRVLARRIEEMLG